MSEIHLKQLRSVAREIFDAALLAVDAREVTRRAITVEDNRIQIGETSVDPNKRIYVVGIGKAASAMAEALDEALGDRIAEGIITSQLPSTLPPHWQIFSSGHPLPNAESLQAAQATFQLLDKANSETAIVIFAVSGGGSAMIEWPVNDAILLEDLKQANRILVTCGATIGEINVVRRAFSVVKGGKLAQRATKAEVVTLIISDTNHGDAASVASGPTLAPPNSTQTAEQIVAKYQLDEKLPATILRAIHESRHASLTQFSRAAYYVLAENQTAIDAAVSRANSMGFRAIRAEEISEQPIVEGCERMIQRLMHESGPLCLISGGEFSCPVRGDGLGGRNLETVLRCAIGIADNPEHIVVLSAGTDGIDGNSPAAGAIGDETTFRRAQALGLDASKFLARSDSFGFLESLGDAIITGPTGTNVRDLRVLLKTQG